MNETRSERSLRVAEAHLALTRESLHKAQLSVRWVSFLVLLMTITLVWQQFILGSIYWQNPNCLEEEDVQETE